MPSINSITLPSANISPVVAMGREIVEAAAPLLWRLFRCSEVAVVFAVIDSRLEPSLKIASPFQISKKKATNENSWLRVLKIDRREFEPTLSFPLIHYLTVRALSTPLGHLRAGRRTTVARHLSGFNSNRAWPALDVLSRPHQPLHADTELSLKHVQLRSRPAHPSFL